MNQFVNHSSSNSPAGGSSGKVVHQLSEWCMLRYSGFLLSCQWFEVVHRPSFEVRYHIACQDGIYSLEAIDGTEVMRSFELINILSFIRKKVIK